MQMPPRIRLLLGLGGLIAGTAAGTMEEGGSGFIHGKNHLFSLTAPSGWVLDNESGLPDGAVAVFYPKGETWKSSPVKCFTRSREKSTKLRTAADLARLTIQHFHSSGFPEYSGTRAGDFHADSGAVGEEWFYRDEAAGLYEAAVYFPGKKRINGVIFTSRTKEDFDRGLPSFEALARSYHLLSEADDPIKALRSARDAGAPLSEDPGRSMTKFDDVALLAHDMGETPEGKAFEKAILEKLGQALVDAAGPCFAKVPNGSDVQLVLIFDGNGTVLTGRYPEGDEAAACLAEKMRGKRGVRPPRSQWMMLFKFNIRDRPPNS